MRLDTLLIRVSAALLAFAAIAWLLSRSINPAPRTDAEIAGDIERYTWNRLAAPYPTGVCETARYVTYAREPGASIADLWYVSSQIMANVALARIAEGDTRRLDCTIERAFDYLELLWQDEPISGYAPRSDLDGSNITTLDIFADDNAIAGVAMLAAADYVSDPELQDRMLRGATRAARYLIDSGLWDDTYGGGFWWNTQRELSEGGKPVQTAGLAAQLFARLYRITDDDEYRRWADRTMDWIERSLFDPEMGLYRIGFRQDLLGIPTQPAYVNYDQSIMIEAHLAMRALGDARLDHLERARLLAHNLERFRSPLGGYEFELGAPQVFTHYSAWTSIGLLKLYELDPNPVWLEHARESLRDLNSTMLDQSDGGVYYDVYACVGDWASECRQGAESGVDVRKVHLSQTWMEHAFALLAQVEQDERSATAAE
ncbi:MAG TPA: glycoside hydrolase family 76 protein [Chloroflexota bacterium]|nr:glycoside hydrolase family 76 protein [Chloroflexota bacterium]